MRLLLMISGLSLSGAERSLVSVIPYLNRLPGVTTFLCTLNTFRDGPLVEEFAQTGVMRFDLGAKRLIDPAAWLRFLKLLDEKEIDIVSTQDQYANLFGALAYWLTKTPIVMARHVMKEPAGSLREAARARLMVWALRHGSHKVIAVSNAVRHVLTGQFGVPLSKIEVIYNGIDVRRFILQDKKESIRRKLGWEIDRPIVIMVAVLRRGKGHEVLFEAIPKLKEAIPNVQIKLVGGGELNDILREQAVQFRDTVEFLGERVDVPELLCASDVFVLPSWSEALPTVLIEAAAAALPVVATNVGGTSEVVMEGRTGYVVRPGNPDDLAERIIVLLKNPEAARRMGISAREHVEKTFSLERQAQSMFALFEKTLGER